MAALIPYATASAPRAVVPATPSSMPTGPAAGADLGGPLADAGSFEPEGAAMKDSGLAPGFGYYFVRDDSSIARDLDEVEGLCPIMKATSAIPLGKAKERSYWAFKGTLRDGRHDPDHPRVIVVRTDDGFLLNGRRYALVKAFWPLLGGVIGAAAGGALARRSGTGALAAGIVLGFAAGFVVALALAPAVEAPAKDVPQDLRAFVRVLNGVTT